MVYATVQIHSSLFSPLSEALGRGCTRHSLAAPLCLCLLTSMRTPHTVHPAQPHALHPPCSPVCCPGQAGSCCMLRVLWRGWLHIEALRRAGRCDRWAGTGAANLPGQARQHTYTVQNTWAWRPCMHVGCITRMDGACTCGTMRWHAGMQHEDVIDACGWL